MMRRSVKALSVILIMVLAVNLTSCSGDAKAIVGTWMESGQNNSLNATITLNSDGTFYEVDFMNFYDDSDPVVFTGTYQLDTKEKIITFRPYDNSPWEYKYTLGTDHMTFEDPIGFASKRTFERQ